MRDAYPELIDNADRVAEMIKGEETRFAHTLSEGLKFLESDLMETVLAELTALPDAAAMTSKDEEGRLKKFSLSRGEILASPGEGP